MNINKKLNIKINVFNPALIALFSLLGVLVGLPTIAQAVTAPTTISSVVGSTISLSTSSTVNINATPTGSGVQTIADDVATVSTNDSAGYTLQLAETGASGNLVSGGNTIAGSAGTQTTPIAEANNTWGYRVDGVGGFGAGPTSAASNAAISGTIKFAGVPATASPNTIKTTSATATNDTTNVWYGVAVTSSQPTGTYTNSVTYTATGN